MALCLDVRVAGGQLELRRDRHQELVIQRVIERVLGKQGQVVEPLQARSLVRRRVTPVAAASDAESWHVVVIHVENFLH